MQPVAVCVHAAQDSVRNLAAHLTAAFGRYFPLYHALHQGGHHSVVFSECWCYAVKENEL